MSIEKLIVDLETGQRGYIISGKEEFLEPYDLAKSNIESDLQALMDSAHGDHEQIDRLVRIRSLIREWHRKTGAPEIAAGRQAAAHQVSRPPRPFGDATAPAPNRPSLHSPPTP